MKAFGYIFVILVAGLLGYALYPKISPILVQAGWIESCNASEQPQPGDPGLAGGEGEKKQAVPAGESQAEPVAAQPSEPKSEPAPAPGTDAGSVAKQLEGLNTDRLPERVLLLEAVTVHDPSSDPASGTKMEIPAGQRIKVVRIDGTDVVVSPAPPFEGRIAVAKTDLIKQLGAMPGPKPAPEPPPVADRDPQPQPAPAPVPEPKPVPAPAPAPEPPPVAGNEPAPAPEPPPAQPEPEPAKASPNLDAIVMVMKDSIRSGQIKEFTFDQVLGWKGVGEEEIEGETYDTGLVAYKAETIFGVKTIQAKALILDGKVAKWIWPKSGMEIK